MILWYSDFELIPCGMEPILDLTLSANYNCPPIRMAEDVNHPRRMNSIIDSAVDLPLHFAELAVAGVVGPVW